MKTRDQLKTGQQRMLYGHEDAISIFKTQDPACVLKRPVCKIIPGRPQPRCFLLPVGLELWVCSENAQPAGEEVGEGSGMCFGRNWGCNLSLSLQTVFPFLCQSVKVVQVGSLEQQIPIFCLNHPSSLSLWTVELWPLEAVVRGVF